MRKKGSEGSEGGDGAKGGNGFLLAVADDPVKRAFLEGFLERSDDPVNQWNAHKRHQSF